RSSMVQTQVPYSSYRTPMMRSSFQDQYLFVHRCVAAYCREALGLPPVEESPAAAAPLRPAPAMVCRLQCYQVNQPPWGARDWAGSESVMECEHGVMVV